MNLLCHSLKVSVDPKRPYFQQALTFSKSTTEPLRTGSNLKIETLEQVVKCKHSFGKLN